MIRITLQPLGSHVNKYTYMLIHVTMYSGVV